MYMRDDSGLDQGGSSGGSDIKLDSGYMLVVKANSVCIWTECGVLEKGVKIDSTAFGLSNCKSGVAIY